MVVRLLTDHQGFSDSCDNAEVIWRSSEQRHVNNTVAVTNQGLISEHLS